MRTPDTITAADLPELRATLVSFADTPGFSAALRLACRDAVAAIDRAIAEDAATHARLVAALTHLVAVGQVDCLLHSPVAGTC